MLLRIRIEKLNDMISQKAIIVVIRLRSLSPLKTIRLGLCCSAYDNMHSTRANNWRVRLNQCSESMVSAAELRFFD
jgi:hypothetical protein